MSSTPHAVAADPSELETAVRVVSKRSCADGIVAVDVAAVDGADLPSWEPGAHVDVVIDGVTQRQYSLCGDPDDRSTWRIGVLREEHGRGSSLYVHDRLLVGDEIRLRGPRNNFAFRASPRYLFVAGGIGITPLLAMVRRADRAGADWRLVYGGRRRTSMAFLDELAAYGDRVTVAPQDEVGLLDLDGLLGIPVPDTLVYCCGPEPLLAAVEACCAGWPPHSLEVERFSARPMAEPVLADSFDVVLERSGLTVNVPPDRSVLSVVRAAGVAVLSSCEEGTCGTCETAVLDGRPDHRDSLLDEDERAENSCMMICVSRSLGPRLVLDL